MVKIYRTHDMPLELNVNTLNKIELRGMNFHRCLLNNVDIKGTDLSNSDFRSAEMINSVFYKSIFINAKLIMVKAIKSVFDECVFDTALLMHSDFNHSSFQYANFSKGIMNDVNFAYCDLRGANLDCEGLETCNFNNAIYDEFTKWSKDFDVWQCSAINIK